MWTFIRVAISVVFGFFLMLPLGSLYELRTFHYGWGLMHAYVSAWPTLSIFTFLVLGYLRHFPRVEDAPLLVAGLTWGLVMAGFLDISASLPWLLGPSTFYALLAVTSIIVALLSFFANHKLRLALFVVLPFVFLKMDFLFVLKMPTLRPLLRDSCFPDHISFYDVLFALRDIARPLIFALIGCGLGSLASAVKKQSPTAM